MLERIDGDNATSIRLSPKQDGDTVPVLRMRDTGSNFR